MDDEKFDLNSRIWVWFNSVLSYDNIIAHDFLNEVDGSATFADVVIGLADRCPLSNFLGDTLIGSSALLSKIADLCDVDLDTAFGLWEYASGEDIDQLDKEGILHMIDSAKKAVAKESRLESFSIADINSSKAFDIANQAMLNEIMPSCDDPALYGIAERVLPNLEWRADSIATDVINELIHDPRGKIDLDAVRSHADELFAACQIELAFVQAEYVLRGCETSIQPTDEMHFKSVYTPHRSLRLYASAHCLEAFCRPRFAAVREALTDIEMRSKVANKTPVVPTDVAAAAKRAASANVSPDSDSSGKHI